jgi:hypothetical protein
MPKLMDSYPQLIPNITKLLEPLKTYERRHSHGEERGIINKRYCHSDHGSFDQGVGKRGIGEIIATASTNCKFLVMFSLIYSWPISFKFVYG